MRTENPKGSETSLRSQRKFGASRTIRWDERRLYISSDLGSSTGCVTWEGHSTFLSRSSMVPTPWGRGENEMIWPSGLHGASTLEAYTLLSLLLMELKNPDSWSQPLSTAPCYLKYLYYWIARHVFRFRLQSIFSLCLYFSICFICLLHKFLFGTHSCGPDAVPGAAGPVVDEMPQCHGASVPDGETLILTGAGAACSPCVFTIY